MRSPVGPAWRGYAVAVAASGLTLLARLALDPALGSRQPYCTFHIAVALAAWVGGFGPGLLALLLGAMAGLWFFVGERGTLDLPATGDLVGLLTFLLVGLAVAWLLHRGRAVAAWAAGLNEALRRRAEELQACLDVLPVGVFIADDPHCRVIRANPAGREMLGLPTDSNTSKSGPGGDQLPFRVLRDGAEVPANDLPMQRAARHATAVLGAELEVVRADGTAVQLFEHAVPLFDSAGRVRGCVGAFVDVTAQRRAEQARRQTEDLLQLIADALPVLITYIGADSRYRFANQTYKLWFGLDPDALRGRHVRDVLGQATYDAIRPHMDRAFSGEVVRFEETLPYESGARTVRVTYIPDFAPDGRVRGYVAMIDDVSERKRAEEAVRRSEARYRALMEQSPLSTQVFRPDGFTVSVNRAWEELWGGTLDQVADYNVLADPQLEAKGVAPYIRKGFAGEATAIPAIEYDPNETLPNRTRHKDPRRWVRAFIYPLRDDTGRIAEVVLIHEDITAQRRAEEALHGTAERLLFALTAARMGDWYWDARSDEVVLSERAAEIFGIPARPPRTRPQMRELLHPDDRERVAGEVDRVIAQNTDYDIEYRVQTAAGGWRWVSAKGRAVFGPAGDLLGMSGVSQDVTERKRMDEELRRTVDALREADRLKDEFLAMLAHELRNPLAPIRNALFVLKGLQADPSLRDQVRATAERQVSHMARLLDDLLDVSRISRGKIQLRVGPVDLGGLVARAVDVTRPLVEERRHELFVHAPPEPVSVHGDATRLEQVVTNLLTNAAKYTDPGGRIDVTVEATQAEAVLRVRDTGIGLASDVLPRVFDLFVQVERRLDRARGGVGIGLTLVKRLVELHGGTVEARSEGLGRGSEFVVRLPFADCRPSTSIGDAEPNRQPVIANRQCRRVLVVDDNRDAGDSLALLLRLDGHEVQVVYDGPSALAACAGCRPDIVFLDLGMPGLDGYEVCRRLREAPELAGLRIVALTGWGQDADRRRSAEVGFDHHLVKPADPDELRRVF
jgi:PAS domain S-box-containing protein